VKRWIMAFRVARARVKPASPTPTAHPGLLPCLLFHSWGSFPDVILTCFARALVMITKALMPNRLCWLLQDGIQQACRCEICHARGGTKMNFECNQIRCKSDGHYDKRTKRCTGYGCATFSGSSDELATNDPPAIWSADMTRAELCADLSPPNTRAGPPSRSACTK